jgi:hypothetical protein
MRPTSENPSPVVTSNTSNLPQPTFDECLALMQEQPQKLIKPKRADSVEFYGALGDQYAETTDHDERVRIVASVLDAARRYDLLSRSIFLVFFERNSRAGHICALWGECAEGCTNETD